MRKESALVESYDKVIKVVTDASDFASFLWRIVKNTKWHWGFNRVQDLPEVHLREN